MKTNSKSLDDIIQDDKNNINNGFLPNSNGSWSQVSDIADDIRAKSFVDKLKEKLRSK